LKPGFEKSEKSAKARSDFVCRSLLLGILGAAVSCAAPPARPPSEARSVPGERSKAIDARPQQPAPFEPVATPLDVVAPWVRPERSSRLALALPKGKLHERWTLALDPKLDPAFLVAAGTRIVVQGRGRPDRDHPGFVNASFVLLDTSGVKVATDDLGGSLVRLAPDAGKLFAIGGSGMPTAWQLEDGARGPDKLAGTDDPRSAQGSLAVRAAMHGSTHVFVQPTGVEIDARASGTQRTVVEPPVVPLDAAIDEDANLHVLVRQDKELALWTTPLAGGSVGRIRLGPLRRERADVPPILGKAVRVLVLDDRMVAIAPDGKTLWERRGALTGGATMTSDDRLLVATDAKLLAIDPSGRTTELGSAPREVFLTPPILTSSGLLLAASGTTLHAYAFAP
jgi:hypothetical protein